MTTTLPILLADTLEASEETRARALRAGRRESSLRAYRTHWADFERWCFQHSVQPLPATPSTVGEYLVDQAAAGKAYATISARRTAISVMHRAAGYKTSPAKDPDVGALMADLADPTRPGNPRRSRGKEPISVADLRAYLAGLGSDLRATRDRALLVVGFAGAFRRAELAGLEVEHLRESPDGFTVWLPVTKTGVDSYKFLPYGQDPGTCPVRLLRAWLTAAGISSGPVFRPIVNGVNHGVATSRKLAPQTVAAVVKRCALALGKDPDRFGGHSLRSGFVTQAIDGGADLVSVAKQTGHKSQAVLLGYYRQRAANVNNAVHSLGL